MENNILVSVIIPVYNVRPYLSEALDSIVYQTYTKLEIIIIDDGSTDGSAEICDEYARKDERIRVIHQENRGLSAARNVGLDLFTGEAVAFLDSDDAFRPDYVQSMINSMIQEKADLVVCKFITQNTINRFSQRYLGTIEPPISQGVYNRKSALRALADNSLNHAVWNKMYCRRLWDEVRFPNGHVYEDVDTMFRIINLCETICVLDQPLCYYRRRPGSITASKTKQMYNDRIEAYAHFFSFIESNTPTIFTDNQLKRIRQLRLSQMITGYVVLSRGQDSKYRLAETIRNKILSEIKLTETTELQLRSKAACWIIVLCPWILKIVYPIYHKTAELIYMGKRYKVLSFRIIRKYLMRRSIIIH